MDFAACFEKSRHLLLEGAQELFCSDPEELAAHMAALEQIQPLKIFGGCCGTDGSHMQAIAKKISGQ